jgi:hypothetical protein
MSSPPIPLSYWPGPTTTGVPPGTALTKSGSLDLRTNGQVITNLDITGRVNVYAQNVTIRKSKIVCDSPYAIRTFDSTVSLVVEDVEIDGRGKTSVAACCGNYTLRRLNIHNTLDGPRLGSSTTIVDCWIHDLDRIPGSHNDTLQTTGGSGILVRHNRLDAYKASTKDPMNACLMVGSETNPLTNLTFEDNYCNGGNYTIGVRTDLVGSNIVFRRNRFDRNYRYGVIARPRQQGITWDSSNVWFDNGKPVVT